MFYGNFRFWKDPAQRTGVDERKEYSAFLQPPALCSAPRQTPGFTRPLPKLPSPPDSPDLPVSNRGPWLPTVSRAGSSFPRVRMAPFLLAEAPERAEPL